MSPFSCLVSTHSSFNSDQRSSVLQSHVPVSKKAGVLVSRPLPLLLMSFFLLLCSPDPAVTAQTPKFVTESSQAVREASTARNLSEQQLGDSMQTTEPQTDRGDWPHNVSAMITALVNNYDNRLRPKFGTKVLDIGMELVLASFDRISEVNMDYTITMYLNQYWHDDRLAFSMKHPRKQMTLTGEFASRIWVPDTFFANDKHSFLHDVTEQNKMIRLSGDGSIMYGMRFTTTLACMMDLHYYPLDSQNCTVEIESYGYPLEDVRMSWKDGRKSVHNVHNIEMPQFTLTSYDVISNIISLSTGKYQRLSLSFRLQRNVGFFVFQTYLPSILIVMLSWVSFWINHEATSARVALGITTVLTMTTISTGVRSALPRISYVKAIDIYLVMCFVFVFAALLEYAAVNYTYWGARSKRKAKRLSEKAQRESLLAHKGKDGNNKTFESDLDAEIRMSPILGIKNNLSRSPDNFDADLDTGGPPSVIRMTPVPLRSYGMRPINAGGLRRRFRGPTSLGAFPNHGPVPAGRKRRLLGQMRRRAEELKKRLPRIKDVNRIDECSRIAFPSLFILFNLGYWCFYLL